MSRLMRVALSLLAAVLVTALVAPFARGSGISNPSVGSSVWSRDTTSSPGQPFLYPSTTTDSGLVGGDLNLNGYSLGVMNNANGAGLAVAGVGANNLAKIDLLDNVTDFTGTVTGTLAAHDAGFGPFLELVAAGANMPTSIQSGGYINLLATTSGEVTVSAGNEYNSYPNSAKFNGDHFYPAGTDLATFPVGLGAPTVGWGSLYLQYTNTATVGDVTINKASGRVNLGAGQSTLTVTDSVVTAASHVFLNPHSAPGNAVAVMFYAVAGAGSFTVNAVPVVTNQTSIDFFVVNAD